MGFLDSLKNLTKPYDDDEDEFFDETGAGEAATVQETRQPVAPRQPSRSPFAQSYGESRRAAVNSRDDKVVNINAAGQIQVVLASPERFESAAEIADHLRAGRMIVMNLEQTNKDIARRLIDFLSGVAYAQDGKIKKVANATYLITSHRVDLMGDLIDELETSGVYF